MNGKNIYSFQQTELTCYTGEVALCQYGVYCDMKKNPSRIPKRVISTTNVTNIIEALRTPPATLEAFMV